MIRMIQSKSSGHAKAYFSDALSKSDYYLNDQELGGFWQGKLAERLGLSGDTGKEQFFALCENLHPLSGETLTPRTKEDRTTGYDINFHCPKSVSIMHTFSKDDHIIDAFRDSVTETMRVIEQDSLTRVRLGGQQKDRSTGELVWGHFVHQTARPVGDSLPDPHLHSHCYVFNATWDEEEKRIKAGQFREIKRDMPFYQAQFHKILSDKLIDLGSAVRQTEKSFEIDGVPQRVIDLFSKRTDEIGRLAKEKGITESKELDGLGARTRSKKQKGCSMNELRQEWLSQVKELGDEATSARVVRFAPKNERDYCTAQQSLDYAVAHSFERASVMSERRLLGIAYRHSIGYQHSIADLDNAYKSDKRIIHVEDGTKSKCTTKEVLAEEERMVALAQRGQGKIIPAYAHAPDIQLSGQQGEAIKHVLTTRNMVAIVRGAAGTGKTTLMKEAVAKFSEAGKQVHVFAPTAQASRGVLREEGFSEASTVAHLLVSNELQNKLKGQVIWADEAGLLGTKEMTALLEIATKQNAQLILGGDTRQHASVVRGDALRILNTVAKIETAEVDKIYRQQNREYRVAVEDLSKANVLAGFRKLDALGFVKNMEQEKITECLIKEYIASSKEGKTAMIISPTNAQGEILTTELRKRLKEEGLLAKKESEVYQLVNLQMTTAEKSDSRNYRDGQVIQFEQNCKDFERGSRWEVEVRNDGVFVKAQDNTCKPFPLSEAERFNVYKQDSLPLSKGEKVMVKHGGSDLNGKRMNNGDVLEFVRREKNNIHLRNVRSGSVFKIEEDYGHIAHAHVITSYGSQGKTVDHIFIHQPLETFPATDAKQFYVSVSRAKERAIIFTNDKEGLMLHAENLAERTSAIELVRNSNSLFLSRDSANKLTEFNREKDHEPDR